MLRLTEEAPLCGVRAAALLSDSACGAVCGLYSGALYLEVGARLLLIASSAHGAVPFGIGLSDYSALHDVLAESGETEARILPNAEGADILFPGVTLSLSRISAFNPVPVLSALPTHGRINECAAQLLKRKTTGLAALATASHACEKSTDNPYFCRALPLSVAIDAELCSATLRGKTFAEANADSDRDAALRDAVLHLVGLGNGLTPSGDDYLSGMLYFFNYFSRLDRKPELERAARRLGAAVTGALERTNSISREYLISAVNGEYFGVTADFAAAMSQKAGAPLDPALERLLSVGSSSGGDIAAGMIRAARCAEEFR